jgi:hypothetical protein
VPALPVSCHSSRTVEFIWTITLTVIGTSIAVIVIANFRKPEKEPHHKVKRHSGFSIHS